MNVSVGSFSDLQGLEGPITPSIHHYDEASCRYIGCLIGHEGEGSLFHALKMRGRFYLGPN